MEYHEVSLICYILANLPVIAFQHREQIRGPPRTDGKLASACRPLVSRANREDPSSHDLCTRCLGSRVCHQAFYPICSTSSIRPEFSIQEHGRLSALPRMAEIFDWRVTPCLSQASPRGRPNQHPYIPSRDTKGCQMACGRTCSNQSTPFGDFRWSPHTKSRASWKGRNICPPGATWSVPSQSPQPNHPTFLYTP